MAEGGGKVAIAVALITTLGVLGAAFIGAWGKREAPTGAAPEIAGVWVDQFGARFEIARAGAGLRIDGVLGERVMQGTGTVDGAAVTFAITNSLEPGTITCAGTIATATAVVATCRDPDGTPFDWVLTRAGG